MLGFAEVSTDGALGKNNWRAVVTAKANVRSLSFFNVADFTPVLLLKDCVLNLLCIYAKTEQ